jgi:ATP-dependent Lon protease
MQVYLFPLSNTVFFPNTSKPLHIFEPRYLKMIDDSLAGDVPIALGYVDQAQAEYKIEVGMPIGFVRQIVGYGKPRIVEKRSDGTQLIFLEAVGKAKLGNLLNITSPYLVVEAMAIEEDLSFSGENTKSLGLLRLLLHNWVKRNIPEVEVRDQFMSQMKTPHDIISCCATFLIIDPDLQQAILEENSLQAKLHLLDGLVASGEVI